MARNRLGVMPIAKPFSSSEVPDVIPMPSKQA
jgi:hypothetical protein